MALRLAHGGSRRSRRGGLHLGPCRDTGHDHGATSARIVQHHHHCDDVDQLDDDHVYHRPPTTTAAPPPPTTSVAPGPPTSPRNWPPFEPLPGVNGLAALTGMPADEATMGRPVVAVKIDNHPTARPQWGLDEADVIVEENVEFLTRFIALFHSRQPAMVGPVRSVRTSDTPVLAALNRPVLGWSGGNAGVIAEVNAAAGAGVIVDAGVYTAGRCYRRQSSRFAPHNLVFDPDCGREASPSAGAARPIFSFGDPMTPRADGCVIEVAMDSVNVRWEFDQACMCYFRVQNGRPHLAASGVQISATNVIVMRVEYVPSPVDARSPEARTEGSGPASVFRGGVQFDGEWVRADAFSPFGFRAGGVTMTLAHGTTFIELARADA